MAGHSGPSIVKDSLAASHDVANIKSYSGTGTEIKDLSGNSKTGTTVSAPTYSTANGGIFTFNGTNQAVSMGNLGTFYTLGTVGFWMRSSSVISSKNVLHTNYTGTGNNVGVRFEQTTGGTFAVVVGNDAGTYNGYTLTTTLAANTWYYVTTTWNKTANTLVAYLNGAQVVSTAHTNWATTMAAVYYGVGFDSTRFFSGSIARVQFYNKVLSASDVKQNFNAIRGRFGI